jgi:hypothetical protein
LIPNVPSVQLNLNPGDVDVSDWFAHAKDSANSEAPNSSLLKIGTLVLPQKVNHNLLTNSSIDFPTLMNTQKNEEHNLLMKVYHLEE